MVRPDADATVVLVRDGVEVASWPLAGTGTGLDVVEALARLQLGARRLGCSIRVRDACPRLSELLDLAGLGEVVRVERLRRQVGGEAEDAEQAGVEEVVVPDDPVA